MRSILFLAAAFFGVSHSANANFTGEWRGAGVLTSSDSSTANCEIAVSVSQFTSTFAMNGGAVDCGEAGQSNVPSVELRIRNGGLYYSIVRVGSITDEYFIVEGERPNVGWNRLQGWITAPTTLRFLHENRKNGVTRVLDAVLER